MTQQTHNMASMLKQYGLLRAVPAAAAAGRSASLEGSPIEQKASNNRAYVRKGLKKFRCERGVVRGVSVDGRHLIFQPVRCNRWECAECGPIRLRKVRAAITWEASRLKLNKMMTLTLPSDFEGDGVVEIYGMWKNFCKRVRREFGKRGKFEYIACLELQPGRGVAHLHILMGIFLPQRWVSKNWRAVGGGRIVDVRRRDESHSARYITDYTTKDFCSYMPKGTRRFRCSRGVQLFKKVKREGYVWKFLDFGIREAWDRFAYDGVPHLVGNGFEVVLSSEKKVLDNDVGKNVVVYAQLILGEGGIYA